MTSVTRPALAVLSLLAFTTISSLPLIAAHEVTFKGTVVSADAKTIKVTVVNEKTKKPETMTFEHDGETHVFRGDSRVTFANARIQKGEKVAVTVDHDEDPDFAMAIRLDEKK